MPIPSRDYNYGLSLGSLCCPEDWGSFFVCWQDATIKIGIWSRDCARVWCVGGGYRHFTNCTNFHVVGGGVGSLHRVRTDREAIPCIVRPELLEYTDYLWYRESLIYPLRVTQLYSSSARCNVHNADPPPPGLIKFSTLGHSICTYAVWIFEPVIVAAKICVFLFSRTQFVLNILQ